MTDEHDPHAHAPESAAFDPSTWTPLPVRSARAPAGALDALLAWAAAAGAWFEPIELAVAADGNRTVRARRALAPGEALLRVPRALLVTDGDAVTDPAIAQVAALEGTMLSPPCALGLWLARAVGAPDSGARPYLDALPPGLPWMPLHRSAVQLAALDGTRALATVAYRARGHRADHALLVEQVAALTGLSLTDFVWGQQVAASRCFRVAIGGRDTRALVPLADMFDHGRDDATWSFHDDQACFELRACAALAAGQEIQLSYGRGSNAGWLSTYGFAVTDCAEDEALLDLPAAGGPAYFAVAARYDVRLKRLLAHARIASELDDGGALARLAVAARATLAALTAAPWVVDDDRPWRRWCERVRAGEAAVAGALVAFVARVGAVADRTDVGWAAQVASLTGPVTGVDRMVRDYAREQLDALSAV